MRDKIYERLCKIHDELAASLRHEELQGEEAAEECGDTENRHELNSTDALKLLKNEPDYTKRIATPLGTKRRRRVTLARVTSS